ncbi:hypothetical protein MSAN_01387600 [Mycena sanguinolenta]|uniref:Uncharacterized protein n=1 Tax=Mycena sanguinolenta TaxID=230812 RepID=A0A8H6Y9P7_9AGAR|nr:hypothetical protein MSAN_01387600 [Mycena sanguinolenta]
MPFRPDLIVVFTGTGQMFIVDDDQRVGQVAGTISALVELRDHKRAYVVAVRNLISRISILPVELLTEIFDLAIRNDNGHVWNIAGRGGDGEQAYADGLKTWLQRFASLVVPVTLVLEYVYCDSESSNNHIRDGVLSTAPRWRPLNVPRTTSLAFVQQLSEGRFDSLEELDLGLERFAGVVSTISISFTVPRLRKLRINMWSNMLHIDILIPWAQLADLTFDSSCPDITFGILAQWTSLVQATVTTSG